MGVLLVQVGYVEDGRQNLVHPLNVTQLLIEFREYEQYLCHYIVTIQSVIKSVQSLLILFVCLPSDLLLLLLSRSSFKEGLFLNIVGPAEESKLGSRSHRVLLNLLPYEIILFEFVPLLQRFRLPLSIRSVLVLLFIEEFL